jgi:hypothetical protein
VPLEWDLIAQGETIPLRPSAHGQARGIAMVQGAVYDAVNAIDRSHQPYLLDGCRAVVDDAPSQTAAGWSGTTSREHGTGRPPA